MIYPPSEFEKRCQATSEFRYDYSYPPGDPRRYGGNLPARWRVIVRRVFDWIRGDD